MEPEQSEEMQKSEGQRALGVTLGITAFCLWGTFPLYFCLLSSVSSVMVLAFRTSMSTLVLLPLVLFRGKLKTIWHSVRNPRIFGAFLVTTSLIGFNWWVFIWLIQTGLTLHSSFSGYMTPLTSVLCGVLLFREHLSLRRLGILLLAALSVMIFALGIGTFPLAGVTISCTFSLYSALRKKIPVDSLSALSIETTLLFIPGILYMIWGTGGWYDPESVWSGNIPLTLLLVGSGIVTAIPLILYGSSTRRIPLSTMGFIQYISPTLQFLTAVYIFHESMTPCQWASFFLIWGVLILFSLDSMFERRGSDLIHQ